MLPINHILALQFLPGITSHALRSVVGSGRSFAEVAASSPETLASLGLKRPALAAIAAGIEPYLEQAEHQIQRAEAFGARIITYWDEGYPEALREIYSPPMALYVEGNLSNADNNAVAIVGTRNATVYGRLCAEKYAARFSQAGTTVVSGLARGVDTYAHTATLDAGGRTIAVIASGLDEISPAFAAQLARKIGRQGAVVSEYGFGVKAMPAFFPQRNRIISGISTGTVVIESDEQGGAMITANFALDQNRETFAVPGPITSPKSRGTNTLIRSDRARLTQSPDDVLQTLGYTIAPATVAKERGAQANDLTAFERKILDELGAEPVHIDTICERTGLNTSEVLVSLLTLEFKGLVRQMAGKMFLVKS